MGARHILDHLVSALKLQPRAVQYGLLAIIQPGPLGYEGRSLLNRQIIKARQSRGLVHSFCLLNRARNDR
jgi:hypothetical protein